MFRRQSKVMVCMAVLTLSGCSREASEEAPAAAESTDAVATEAAMPPPETEIGSEEEAALAAGSAVSEPTDELVFDSPSESSLAIKRGIARSAGDHSLFRACDDNDDLWLVDEGDDMLAQLFAEGMETAYVEVYGERAPVPDGLTAARNYRGIFVLEQLLYAGAPGANGTCAPVVAEAEVTARGNEPSWTVQVTEQKAMWKQQDPAREIEMGTLQSQDAEGTVSYRAKSDKHELELLVAAQPCRDLVSEEYFAFAARASLDGKEFKGCARVGR